MSSSDREVLLALYRATGGPHWYRRQGWDTGWDTNANISSWRGVTVRDGNVVGLNLSNNNLQGPIPKELGQLLFLETLNLSGNKLNGPIPKELGQLSSLATLDLSGNKLNGPIPKELGQLSSLATLDLSGNKLNGPIPVELAALSELVGLLFSNNQLTGPIPKELGQLSSLEILDLCWNKLNGSIPKELAAISKLVKLHLQNNQLTGSIPKELAAFSKLVMLDFQNNQLTGSIPKELEALSDLKELYLQNNQLTGSIPKELAALSKLVKVDLGGNLLTGSIPKELAAFSKLVMLDFQNNQLTGSIPKELEALSDLKELYLQNNQLTGSIPKELAALSKLVKVDLGGNQLTDDDVTWLGVEAKEAPFGAADESLWDDILTPEWERTGGSKDSRIYGKVGDQSSDLNLPLERSKSPEGLLDDIQKQPGDEKAARNLERDEEQSNHDEHETVLAESLGTQAAVSFSSSFGVELILEDMSLEQEVKEKVVVKQEIRYVTCSGERDMSKTHDELLMWASEDDIGKPCERGAFLAMPIVYGPSKANFNPDRPARLRFFAGYFDDLQKIIQDGSEEAGSDDAVKKYLQQVYEPLVSADGDNWRMLTLFEVQFKSSPDERKEAWLETRLYHFSLVSIGKRIPNSEGEINQLNLPTSILENDRMSMSSMPWLTRLENRGSVILGNATKKDLFFYACKKEDVKTSFIRRLLRIIAPVLTAEGEMEQGASIMNHGMDRILKHEVHAGRYKIANMPMDGNWLHSQIVCGVFLPEQLSTPKRSRIPIFSHRRQQFFLLKELLNKNRIFVVLPKTICVWNNQKNKNKLAYDPPLPKVWKFLLTH